MPADFVCCECGRNITAITADVPPDPRLCLLCTNVPGWFRHPQVRAAIDPEHDGSEPALAGVPVWEPQGR